MNTISKIIITALSFSFIISCGDNKKNEADQPQSALQIQKKQVDSLYDEVMKEHDIAMPKMGDLMRLKKETRNIIDSLQNEDVDITLFENSIKSLEDADEEMMQWMRDFQKQELDSANFKKVIDYYKEQKKSIHKVHENMKKAMSKADSLLNN